MKLETTKGDNTAYLRSILENETIQIVSFPENERILAEGKLEWEIPKDTDEIHYGYGVMRLQNRDGILIEGNGSTVYNTDAAVEYPNRGVRYGSYRGNLKVFGTKNVVVRDLTLESANVNSEYHHIVEFEHGIHLHECENVLLENIKTYGTFGCGIYVGGKYNQKNVYVINPELRSTGRMGLSVSHCENLYVKNLQADSARGPFDVEPPTDKYFNKNIVLDGGKIKSNGGFFAFPIGGNGTVDTLLIQDVEYYTGGGTAYIHGGLAGSVRKNIILSGNKALSDFGSSKAAYIINAQNVLIEKESRTLDQGRSRTPIQLSGSSENIHIRYNNWVNGEYIKVWKGFDLSRIKQYGNSEKLYALEYDPERINPSEVKKGEKYEIYNPAGFDFSQLGAHETSNPKYYKNKIFVADRDGFESDNNEATLGHIISTTEIPEYTPTDEEKNTIPFEVDEFVLSAYEKRFEVPKDYELLDFLSQPKPEPKITYEEVVETKSIPFNTVETDIKSEARNGKEGVLKIYYKVTLTDGVETNREETDKKIITLPVDEIVYISKPEPTPEPIPQPVETKKKWYQNKVLWIIGALILAGLLILIL